MATYKTTPGVYVQEISTLPPSVADVATAIPAFIGYTQFHKDEAGKDILEIVPRRIKTMRDYVLYFGGSQASTFKVDAAGDGPARVIRTSADNFILYYSLKLYFENGGGPCYIVSVGGYDDTPAKAHFMLGLAEIEKVDEATLLVFPEAIFLDDYDGIYEAALGQCKKLGDRFTIMDVKADDKTADGFRNKVDGQTEELKYGAAYMPFLDTSIPYEYKDTGILVGAPASGKFSSLISLGEATKLRVSYTGTFGAPKIAVSVADPIQSSNKIVNFIIDNASETLQIVLNKTSVDGDAIMAAWPELMNTAARKRGFEIIEATGDLRTIPPTPLTSSNKFAKELSIGAAANNNNLTVEYHSADPTTGFTTPKVAVVISQTTQTLDIDFNVDEQNQTLTISIKGASAIGTDLKAAWDTRPIPGFTITEANGDITTLNAQQLDQDFTGSIDLTDSLTAAYEGVFTAPKVAVQLEGNPLSPRVAFGIKGETLTIKIKATPMAATEINAAWATEVNKNKFTLTAQGFIREIPVQELTKEGTTATAVDIQLNQLNVSVDPTTGKAIINSDTDTAKYNKVKQALAKQYLTLPPSAAMAGIYARVDRDRGVWKSPANVSVLGIIGPALQITAEDQELLNVDATSGKSINVIRSFTGKGTLVWGARTLAGNDNEWRYISVRRLFNLIEESVQKSTAFAVFEPNDAGTWLKVKAMIDSYLYGLWQQGALAGSVPEQAYVVNVGLGKTMNTQDILEGRMNVEIGLAAVRPAEFIYLKFSHKLQEA